MNLTSKNEKLIVSNAELCAELHLGARVWFEGEAQGYTVQARSERFIVLNKPFNLKKTTLYCIIDIEQDIRGPENLVFGAGAETREQCQAMVDRLEDPNGVSEVSYRNNVPLKITKAAYTVGARKYD